MGMGNSVDGNVGGYCVDCCLAPSPFSPGTRTGAGAGAGAGSLDVPSSPSSCGGVSYMVGGKRS